MIELSSRQRKALERLANSLEPNVIVGQNGITEGLEAKVAMELDAHELIKIKFNEFKDEKRELAEAVSKNSGASLVRIIGNVAVLYKPQHDTEKRKIKI